MPKGPTLDPKTRRMAVHVEDHPIEYFDFEGVIPAKQYGAGDVIVWDWGTWEPEAPTLDGRQGVRDGELKFRLNGEKLQGRFTIVRTSRRPGSSPQRAFEDDDGEQWLLIHKRDEHSVAGLGRRGPPAERQDRPDQRRGQGQPRRDLDQPGAGGHRRDRPEPGPSRRRCPSKIEPMLATLATKPFDDDDWLFEIKWDGFRVQAVVDRRHGPDPDPQPQRRRDLLPAAAATRRAGSRPSRPSSMARSWRSTRTAGPTSACSRPSSATRTATGLVYQAFDLLYLDGRSLLDVPLEDRKRLLKSVLKDHPRVRFASHVVGEGMAFFEAAEQHRRRGHGRQAPALALRAGRRTQAWLKIKIRPEQELVVGGWTPGSGNARDLGALAIGVYEDGKLRFAGKVGSGFTGADPGGPAEAPQAARPGRPAVRPARRRRTTVVAGAATSRASPGSGPSSSSGPRSAAGRATATSARRPSRASSPAATRRPSQRETAVTTATAVRAAEAEEPDRCRLPSVPPKATKSRGHGRAAPVASEAATDDELAALEALGKEGVWPVGGHELKLTNLDKPLFEGRARATTPGPITKRELIRYFARIAPTMLPHLHDRPLNLQRFPNGAGAPGLLAEGHARDRAELADDAGTRPASTAGPTGAPTTTSSPTRSAALCWLGNQASFEIHAWTGKLPEPWQPTFAYIDIDPGEKTTWEETLTLARLYRTALGHLGVRGYPKTTGKRGIQVWIPIEHGRYDFSDTSDWVEKVSRAVGSTVPDLISWEWATKARKGRARLDYTQNAIIKTLVAPYCVRPAVGAPVSRADHLGRARRPRPAARPLDGPRPASSGSSEVGDLFAAAQTDAQVLPAV